jgi:hypothetical protein
MHLRNIVASNTTTNVVKPLFREWPSWRRGSRSVRSSVKQKRRCRFALLLLLFFPSSSIVYRGGGGAQRVCDSCRHTSFSPFLTLLCLFTFFFLSPQRQGINAFIPFFFSLLCHCSSSSKKRKHLCTGATASVKLLHKLLHPPFPKLYVHTHHTHAHKPPLNPSLHSNEHARIA